jgi:hypothetical protein
MSLPRWGEEEEVWRICQKFSEHNKHWKERHLQVYAGGAGLEHLSYVCTVAKGSEWSPDLEVCKVIIVSQNGHQLKEVCLREAVFAHRRQVNVHKWSRGNAELDYLDSCWTPDTNLKGISYTSIKLGPAHSTARLLCWACPVNGGRTERESLTPNVHYPLPQHIQTLYCSIHTNYTALHTHTNASTITPWLGSLSLPSLPSSLSLTLHCYF